MMTLGTASAVFGSTFPGSRRTTACGVRIKRFARVRRLANALPSLILTTFAFDDEGNSIPEYLASLLAGNIVPDIDPFTGYAVALEESSRVGRQCNGRGRLS
jgi:hypothetical protein